MLIGCDSTATLKLNRLIHSYYLYRLPKLQLVILTLGMEQLTQQVQASTPTTTTNAVGCDSVAYTLFKRLITSTTSTDDPSYSL